MDHSEALINQEAELQAAPPLPMSSTTIPAMDASPIAAELAPVSAIEAPSICHTGPDAESGSQEAEPPLHASVPEAGPLTGRQNHQQPQERTPAAALEPQLFFNGVPEDILVNILCRADHDDPRVLARLACVCTRFAKVIRTTCWKFRCIRTLPPALIADLLQNPSLHGEPFCEPPGGWGSLQKLLVCCPGLWHAGVLLESWDFGLDREFGWFEVSQSGLINSAHNIYPASRQSKGMTCNFQDYERSGKLCHDEKQVKRGFSKLRHTQKVDCASASEPEGTLEAPEQLGKASPDECQCDGAVPTSSKVECIGDVVHYLDAEANKCEEGKLVTNNCSVVDGHGGTEDVCRQMTQGISRRIMDPLPLSADIDGCNNWPSTRAASMISLGERKRSSAYVEVDESDAASGPIIPVDRAKSLLLKANKRQRKHHPELSHVATGSWSLSREQGNKLLANRFRADSLYICDWPGCIHPGEKRNYKLFRGVFKNFKNSHVWRNLKDMKAKATYVGCAFCSCKFTWDMVTTFCLKRSIEYHDDGEPVVRAYVCENGHVAGAWTDRPIYNL